MLTDQARYRLIGTVFLVAVAAVVLPMLLDGEGVESMQLDAVAPAEFTVEPDAEAPPDMSPALEARRQLAAEIDDEGYSVETGARIGEPVLVEELRAPVDAAVNAGALPAPAPKWAVQVAAFTQRENAERLRDKLLSDNRTAFLSDVKRDGETMTRVAVGPFVNKDDADRERNAIDQHYGVSDGVSARVVGFGY